MTNLKSTKLVAIALMASALTASMAGGAFAREQAHVSGLSGHGGGLGQILEHHHGGVVTGGTPTREPGSDWTYPVPTTMPAYAQYPNVAACEARFRTYNPTTNEYVGLDHQAHYCSLGTAG